MFTLESQLSIIFMKSRLTYFSLIIATFIACQSTHSDQEKSGSVEGKILRGTLEVVAELDINPGNVAVSNEGKVFMTVHPLRRQNVQLVVVENDGSYTPFPSVDFQTPNGQEITKGFDTPLGVIVDKKDRLWVIDAGLSLGKARIFAFQATTGQELYRFEIPSDMAPPTSFVQDLAIDETYEWVYLADFGNPGIIALDIANRTFRKFRDSTMLAEDIDMVIDDKAQNFQGEPARIAINPITIF